MLCLEIGMGLTLFGSIFLALGVLLLFDRALLSLGNLLFLAGIVFWIGMKRAVLIFLNPEKWRGTVCFFLGITLVVFGFPIIGMLIEVFGIINLFGNFFPVVLAALKKLPIIGSILNAPVISTLADKLAGRSTILPLYDRD